MSGEEDLNKLLADMQPILHWETFVFVTTSRDISHLDIRPKMQFREEEGTTLILTRREAETHGFACVNPSRMITLNVHSSLAAVGFLAAITTELASHGISVNPVSGFYHDHLFIPEERGEEAHKLLLQMSGAEPPSP